MTAAVTGSPGNAFQLTINQLPLSNINIEKTLFEFVLIHQFSGGFPKESLSSKI